MKVLVKALPAINSLAHTLVYIRKYYLHRKQQFPLSCTNVKTQAPGWWCPVQDASVKRKIWISRLSHLRARICGIRSVRHHLLIRLLLSAIQRTRRRRQVPEAVDDSWRKMKSGGKIFCKHAAKSFEKTRLRRLVCCIRGSRLRGIPWSGPRGRRW